MVAVLMLLYHVILCKFILYLKSQFWENTRSKPVLITLCKVLCRRAICQLRFRVGRKVPVKVTEISWKKVRNLPFQLLLSPYFSSSAKHGGRHFLMTLSHLPEIFWQTSWQTSTNLSLKEYLLKYDKESVVIDSKDSMSHKIQ